MSDATPRFALPFILPGQAQKELFHNEALTGIDLLLHATVEGAPLVSPPSDPDAGQCWLVASDATGAWAGKDHALAMWTDSGWRFRNASEGLSVWDRIGGFSRRWDGSAWSAGELDCSAIRIGGAQILGPRQPAVPSPSGGTIIDTEARSAIAAVVAALMSHGLIE